MTFAECVKACSDPNDVPQLNGKDGAITNADLQRDDWYVANMIRLKRRERRLNMTWAEACERAKTHWVLCPSYNNAAIFKFIDNKLVWKATPNGCVTDIAFVRPLMTDAIDWQDAEDQT